MISIQVKKSSSKKEIESTALPSDGFYGFNLLTDEGRIFDCCSIPNMRYFIRTNFKTCKFLKSNFSAAWEAC